MYTIREKQELTDALKDEKFFMQDLSLFQNRFPRSPMNRELARANDINRSQLCGRMIYALLDVVTAEEIELNREVLTQREKPQPQAPAEADAAPSAQVAATEPAAEAASGKKKGAKKRSSRK